MVRKFMNNLDSLWEQETIAQKSLFDNETESVCVTWVDN